MALSRTYSVLILPSIEPARSGFGNTSIENLTVQHLFLWLHRVWRLTMVLFLNFLPVELVLSISWTSLCSGIYYYLNVFPSFSFCHVMIGQTNFHPELKTQIFSIFSFGENSFKFILISHPHCLVYSINQKPSHISMIYSNDFNQFKFSAFLYNIFRGWVLMLIHMGCLLQWISFAFYFESKWIVAAGMVHDLTDSGMRIEKRPFFFRSFVGSCAFVEYSCSVCRKHVFIKIIVRWWFYGET